MGCNKYLSKPTSKISEMISTHSIYDDWDASEF